VCGTVILSPVGRGVVCHAAHVGGRCRQTVSQCGGPIRGRQGLRSGRQLGMLVPEGINGYRIREGARGKRGDSGRHRDVRGPGGERMRLSCCAVAGMSIELECLVSDSRSRAAGEGRHVNGDRSGGRGGGG
jgi:hypothetical protein